MIVVFGATGTVGRELLRLLIGCSEAVRAVTRSPQQAAALFAPGIEVQQGDFTDPADLKKALGGAGKVFLLTPSNPQQVEIESKIIDAARLFNVNYMVKLSTLGAGENSAIAMSRWHRQAEKLIERSGMAWTFLRPQSYMQNLISWVRVMLKENCWRAPLGEGRLGLVDARDVAAVAASVLTQDGHHGQIYRITGSERLSFHDIAEQCGAALGRTIRYKNVSEDEAAQDWRRLGWPEWLINDQLAIFRYFRQNQTPRITNIVKQITGKPARTLADFLKDSAALFA